MHKKNIESAKQDMENSIDALKDEYSKLKAGKLNPSLLEDLLVDYYGSKTPLRQLASIGVLEPRVLAIKPYDKGSLKAIETAISVSGLGLSSNVDQDLVRVIAPELTEDRRKELVKILGQKTEETRISIRNSREKNLKEIKELETSGDISEDDRYKAQEELDGIVSTFNKQVKEMEDAKEKEIMTV